MPRPRTRRRATAGLTPSPLQRLESKMRRQGEQRDTLSRPSPATTTVPDSQSPEPPKPRPHPLARIAPHLSDSSLAPAAPSSHSSETFLQPALPIRRLKKEEDPADALSSTSSVVLASHSSSLSASGSENRKPKRETSPTTSSVNSARSTPSRNRSAAPAPPKIKGEDDKDSIERIDTPSSTASSSRQSSTTAVDIEVKPKTDEMDLSASRTPQASVTPAVEDVKPVKKEVKEQEDFSSAVNSLRLPNRTRERAPSVTPQPKEDGHQYEPSHTPSPTPSSAAATPAAPPLSLARSAAVDVAMLDGAQSFGGGFDSEDEQPRRFRTVSTLFRGEGDDVEDRRFESVEPRTSVEAEEEAARADAARAPSVASQSEDEVEEIEEEDKEDKEETPLETSEKEGSEYAPSEVGDKENGGRKKRKPKKAVVLPKKKQKKQGSDEEEEEPIDYSKLPYGRSVKTRLHNELALTTQVLHTAFGDEEDHVVREVPDARLKPRPPPPPPPTPPPPEPRSPSPVDSLPDYIDEDQPGPEAIPSQPVETLIIENDPYLQHPTRAGALSRWITFVAKDSIPLDNFYSYQRYQDDRTTLISLDQPPPSDEALGIVEAVDDVLSSDLETLQHDSPPSFLAFLSSRPSEHILDELWTDFLHPLHPERHIPVREGDSKKGRRCYCPLWEDDKKRSYADVLSMLGNGAVPITSTNLVSVVEDVFGGTTSYLKALSSRLGVVQPSQEDIVERIFELNSMWFKQLVEFASTKRCYERVHRSSTSIVADAFAEHLVAKEETVMREMGRLEAEQKQLDDQLASGKMDAIKANKLNADLLLLEAKWGREKPALESLLERLGGRVDPQIRSWMEKDPGTGGYHWRNWK